MSKLSPEKWDRHKTAYIEWWNVLTINQKVAAKRNFESFRERNLKTGSPYPNMYNTSIIRISQLSDKHIYRIWVFRDRTSKDNQ